MKRNFKKLAGLLALMLTSFTAVYATDYIGELGQKVGSNQVPFSNVTYSTDSDYAYEGVGSVHVKGGKDTPINITDYSINLGVEEGKSYIVSFYVKGSYNGFWIRANSWNSGQQQVTASNGTDSGKDGWKKFTSKMLTASNSTNSQLLIAAEGNNDIDFYLDNLKVVEVDPTQDNAEVKTLVNAGFEPIGARADHEPKNVLITNRANPSSTTTQMVSWRNPDSGNISKVSLYQQEEEGGWKLLADSDSTAGKITTPTEETAATANAICEYEVAGLAAYNKGTVYTYKLVFEFLDGHPAVEVITAAPVADHGVWPWVGWADKGVRLVPESSGGATNIHVNAEIDYDVTYDDTPSVRIYSNIVQQGLNSAYKEIRIYGTEYLQPGDYRVILRTRGNNVRNYEWRWRSSNATVFPRPLTWQNDDNDHKTSDGHNFGWFYSYQDVTVVDTAVTPIIYVKVERPEEDIWIDGIEIYKKEDGKTTGENLFVPAYVPASRIAEITGLSVENGNGSAAVKWTANTTDEVAVYIKDEDGTLRLRAKVPASVGSADIKLPNNTDTTLLVRKITNGVPSDGTTLTAHPTAPVLEIGEFELSGSGNEKTVRIDITNNGAGDEYTAHLILAAFKGNMMTSIAMDPEAATIAQDSQVKTLTKSITLADGESLRAYLWDSIDGMTPIKDSEELVAAQ